MNGRPPLFWGLLVPFLVRTLAPRALFESPLLVAARHPWLALGGAGAALAIGGLAVAASGVMPIKASSGHWAITEWFLQFSKRQSVSTHSFRIEPPPLDDPALVLRGAGHYDLGCAPCHGSPGRTLPRIAAAMTAAPPDLDETVPTWRAGELFYIVKHGIKFTGMPAWPTQTRDDEVWAMVAFLRELPGLDAEAYRQLARGEDRGPFDLTPETAGEEPAQTPEVVVDVCARCHGIDGRGRGDAFPSLAGQRQEYLARALDAYADGRRHSGVMGPIAGALTADERTRAAEHYARQTALAQTRVAELSAAARGEQIARQGIPERKIPSCADCHGPGAAETNPAYPRLAGQYASYISQQLELLKARHRGGSEYVELMHTFVDRLEDSHIQDVAAYYASLQPLR